MTLFVFILIANWISVLPVQYSADGKTEELLKPPASDINFVLALALFVFLCYHAAGIWRRGLIGHPIKVLKGHVAFRPDQHRRGTGCRSRCLSDFSATSSPVASWSR